MLSEFLVYLRLGFEHITDPGGLDHILFVAVLTATDVDRPKHLFWLVTAFTLGHSLTLALATLRVVSVGSTLVEILIPLTVIATCVLNVAGWRPSGSLSARGGLRCRSYEPAASDGRPGHSECRGRRRSPRA